MPQQLMQWRFNPPLAPHFSGVHEVMIKSAKKAILNSADISHEELRSAVVGAEGLLNSRPITYQSANPADLTPSTPSHFLHDQLGRRFAPKVIGEVALIPGRDGVGSRNLFATFGTGGLGSGSQV